MNSIPKYGDYWTPLLKAMKLLGVSGTVDEINAKAIELMKRRDA